MIKHAKFSDNLTESSLKYFHTNSMHLQSTAFLQSEAHLESSRASTVELFSGNSRRL